MKAKLSAASKVGLTARLLLRMLALGEVKPDAHCIRYLFAFALAQGITKKEAALGRPLERGLANGRWPWEFQAPQLKISVYE